MAASVSSTHPVRCGTSTKPTWRACSVMPSCLNQAATDVQRNESRRVSCESGRWLRPIRSSSMYDKPRNRRCRMRVQFDRVSRTPAPGGSILASWRGQGRVANRLFVAHCGSRSMWLSFAELEFHHSFNLRQVGHARIRFDNLSQSTSVIGSMLQSASAQFAAECGTLARTNSMTVMEPTSANDTRYVGPAWLFPTISSRLALPFTSECLFG